MSIQEKIAAHQKFWDREGPCLILIPPDQSELYDVEGYRERFYNPRLMWEAEIRRAQAVIDWPTDGIPTVRPNLGVIFIPVIAGQNYQMVEGQMPWPGDPLSREQLRAIPDVDIEAAALMQLAAEFYRIHQAEGGDQIIPYHPDTQSVYDIAHLLDGTNIFYEVYDDPDWVHKLLEICLDLYLRVTKHLKTLLDEADSVMIHGHGTPQGVYFPAAGARTSEDTATLLSPRMIAEFVIAYMERAIEPFGGGFVHFCGRHQPLFEQLCRSPQVRAIDLGNSEMYDPRWLFEHCAAMDIVLYSRMAVEPGEDWQTYIRRLACLVRATGVRVILRPLVYPESRAACADMLDMWHELTYKN